MSPASNSDAPREAARNAAPDTTGLREAECDRCANHDPRDRRDHGHLTARFDPTPEPDATRTNSNGERSSSGEPDATVSDPAPLTDAEREVVANAAVAVNGYFPDDLFAACERIVATRVAEAVEQERTQRAFTGHGIGTYVDALYASAEALEQERAARLALVAKASGLADEWTRLAGKQEHPATRTLAEAADDLRALLTADDTKATS